MSAGVPTLVFREWAKENGFRRKGTTLYRDQQETIAVIKLQGSRYGGRYFLNVALWLKAVGEATEPKEHHCHMRTRLSYLRPAPNDDERQELFLDLESGLTDEERRTLFRQVLDSVVATALSHTGSLADLRAHPALVRQFVLGHDACGLLGLPGLGMAEE